MRSVGKVPGFCVVRAGDVTVCTGLEQGAHDGDAECAGTTGYDYMTIAKIHECSVSASGVRYSIV
jgi:hypothetical protein